MTLSDVTKLFNSYLISQSGLNKKFIRDATTLYGAFLNKTTSTDIFQTLSPSDLMILFELKTRQSNSDMSQTKDDDKIFYVSSYTLRIMIYGNSSSEMANKLIARFRTEKIRNEILANNVYIEEISKPERITEFKNNVVWIRTDFDIDISCEFEISQTSLDSNFVSINKLNID